MRGSLAKCLSSFLIAGLALPVAWMETSLAAPREASFVEDVPAASPSGPSFSGLAALPDSALPTLTPTSSSPQPAATPVLPAPVVQAPDPFGKVDIATLAQVSPESVGARLANDLGPDMWKGTSRPVAEKLLSMLPPTTSSVLNDTARRLLATAAVPPEGDSSATPNLTSLRIQKLIAFGDAPSAWSLASGADQKLIDDETYHQVVDVALIGGNDEICARTTDIAQARASVDWQKTTLICQLRAHDAKAAQVTMDVLRASPARDDIFLQVAEKNVLNEIRTLPTQLTPLNAPLLTVLRLANAPLPGQLYGRPSPSLIPGMLRAPAKQDVAQLGLAERAAERGIIDADRLGEIYKTVVFKADALASPLTSTEAGSRLRSLLYQTAIAEINVRQRINLTLRFMRVSPPGLLNGAGGVLASMLGEVKADATYAADAYAIARVYMLAGKGTLALDWYRLARQSAAQAFGGDNDLQAAWPQMTMAGFESATDYVSDLDKWVDGALKLAEDRSDAKVARENIATALLLLEANGFAVPDSQWARFLATPTSNEKRFALLPVLLQRLRAAAVANRRAETVLLAMAVAGEGDIPVFAVIEISRSLRQVGLKAEAATFARQALALLTDKPTL